MSNKAKWAATAIAIVLAFVAIAAAFVGIFSDGFTNWDKFKPEEEQTETAGLGGMVVGESVGSGVKLMSTTISTADYDDYGISPMAESAQMLTATITPSSATNKEVDWSVKWKNPSSSWASGKSVTNYVTVTPTSDGALTANVECKQAFGEPVQVVCTSRQNSEASATVQADYAKRIVSGSMNYKGDSTGSVQFTSSGSEYKYTASSALEDIYIDTSSVFTPVYGVGTLTDDFTYDITISFDADWPQTLVDVGQFYGSMVDDSYVNLSLDGLGKVSMGSLMGIDVLTSEGYNYVYQDAQYGSNGAYNAFCDSLRSMNGATIFTMKVVATGEYSTFTGTCEFSCNASALVTLVEDLNISTPSIVF